MIHVHERSPGELHALDPFLPHELLHELPMVWRCVPTSAALVLGSRQPLGTVDRDRCLRAGLDVATRRSGGGAVLIVPGDIVWIDVVVPQGLLPDDVRASMITVGHWWRQAIIDAGIGAGIGVGIDELSLTVHEGGMVPSAWSDLVCFAGIGPGEVLLGDRKLVGLSQRRTRHGARIQGMVHLRTDLASMAPLFDVAVPHEALTEPASLPDVDGSALAAHIAEHLAAQLATRVAAHPV